MIHLTSSAVESFVEHLSPLDRHFSSLIEKLSGQENPQLRLVAALASYSTIEQGHVCLNLKRLPRKLHYAEGLRSINVPAPRNLIAALKQTQIVGKPGDFRPLIIDDQARLYLHRYWMYENAIATEIKRRVHNVAFNKDQLKDSLARLFPTDSETSINWQKLATVAAVTHNFAVISGGPGTGKTTTVLKILAALLEQAHPRKLRIALTAPTGKATARLQQTVQNGKTALDCSEEIKSALPETASTIHRLLGAQFHSARFRHDEKNVLPVDVVVVDEASMVDVALMAKLLKAIPETARVILVGDKDQLSSVEAGAVLGDICGEANNEFSENFASLYHELTGEQVASISSPAAIQDAIVLLRKTYRFSASIAELSSAINAGDEEATRTALQNHSSAVRIEDLPLRKELPAKLRLHILQHWNSVFEATEPAEKLRHFDAFRIVSAMKTGPLGVVDLNEQIEAVLAEERLIPGNQKWYAGRPILITQNSYDLDLFNGDIGVVALDPVTKEIHVFFPGENNTIRKVPPVQLPEHETAFAMTVHKSQGSEFENILLVLPLREGTILNRELVYTAITRARKSVTIWSSGNAIENAAAKKQERNSGLNDRLWGPVT